MNQSQQLGAAGLCATCRHMRLIRSDRGSVFYVCGLSATDPRFKKYPALPVLACSGYLSVSRSVKFFESQFQRQMEASEFELNPFERLALNNVQGTVLDLGCGLGNLALEAARRGCAVTAIDASPTAIARIRSAAYEEHLTVEAVEANLADFQIARDIPHDPPRHPPPFPSTFSSCSYQYWRAQPSHLMPAGWHTSRLH